MQTMKECGKDKSVKMQIAIDSAREDTRHLWLIMHVLYTVMELDM